MASPLRTLLFLALAAVPAAAQHALLARADGAAVDVVRVDPAGSQTLVDDLLAADAVLLGAPRHERLSAVRPRSEAGRGLVPAHVRLPSGTRIWRGSVAGRDRLLAFDAGGDVRDLLVADPGDAIAPGLAVDATGGTLAALVDGPGGERVALVDVVGGGATLVALPGALGESLRVAGGRAWCVDAVGGVHSIDVGVGVVTSAGLPLAVGEGVLPEIVVSQDGSRAVVVAEQTPSARRLFAVSASGSVDLVTPTAGAYDAPSLTRPDGPLIAVSPDGALVAFRETTPAVVPFRDVVVRALGAAQTTNITSDADFIDTLNDTGVISFVAPQLVTFFLGERAVDPDVVIESSDIFSAQLDAAGASTALTNLTATSSDESAPFTSPGTLEVLDVVRDAREERLLVTVDPQGADAELLIAPLGGSAAPSTIMSDLEGAPSLSVAGDVVIALAPASEDLFPVGSTRLDVVPPLAVGAPRSLGVVPPGVDVSRFAASPTGTELALVVSVDAATELGVVADASTGAAVPLAPILLAWGDGLAYTANGALVAPVGAPGAHVVVAWSTPTSPAKLALPVGVWQAIDVH